MDFDLPDNLLDTPIEDFNISKEYTPEPLVCDGKYNGIVMDVKHLGDAGIIKWTVQLQNNPGSMCADNVTPVDGKRLSYNLWLPKKGDELVPGKFSNLTARQETINGMKRFADTMKIKLDSAADIAEAIKSHLWNSLIVVCTIKSSSKDGVIYQNIKKMERA